MRQPRLVLCNGAQPPGQGFERQRILELDALAPQSDVHLRLENVTDAFARQLPPRFVDLLELATYVFVADCDVSRELKWTQGDSTEQWARDFHFVVPVREPEFWQRDDVSQTLVQALQFLSSDRFSFDFCSLRQHRDSRNYLEIGDEDIAPFKKAERVILFSGGLDSLAGAVEAGRRGEPLVLVSHVPVSRLKTRQAKLASRIREELNARVFHVPVWVNKTGHDREPTQRTRTFLFASLGAAVAQALGIRGIRFYENGVVSLNLPVASEALSSRASRTTHPLALHYLQDLLRQVTETEDFAIDNPFVFSTKHEVVLALLRGDATGLIRDSCSCSRIRFHARSQTHCGMCGQCIDRRIAILRAGLAECDSETDYATCVFTGERPLDPEHPYDHNIAVNYLRFCRDLQHLSEDGILVRHSKELSRAARVFPDPHEATLRFIRMLKRHADSVLQVLEEQLRLHCHRLLDHTLPETSLLGMATRRELQPATPTTSAGMAATLAERNIFRKEGEFWNITFRGKCVKMRHALGFQYIHTLLSRPDKDVSSLELQFAAAGRANPDNAVDAYAALADLHDSGRQWDDSLSPQEVMDEAYLRDCQKSIRRAKTELEKARRRGNKQEESRLQKEVALLERTLSQGIGKAGRRRRFADRAEKARQGVRKAIGRALKNLSKEHPALHDHLSKHLRFGRSCCYVSEVTVTWEL